MDTASRDGLPMRALACGLVGAAAALLAAAEAYVALGAADPVARAKALDVARVAAAAARASLARCAVAEARCLEDAGRCSRCGADPRRDPHPDWCPRLARTCAGCGRPVARRHTHWCPGAGGPHPGPGRGADVNAPVVNVYHDPAPHAPTRIVGNRDGLVALRTALDDLLRAVPSEGMTARSPAAVYDSDGEGYDVAFELWGPGPSRALPPGIRPRRPW